jgi:hypothetical protein
MSSPNHMMTPVPAVIVMTMSRMAYQASFAISSPHAPWSLPNSWPLRATVMSVVDWRIARPMVR